LKIVGKSTSSLFGSYLVWISAWDQLWIIGGDGTTTALICRIAFGLGGALLVLFCDSVCLNGGFQGELFGWWPAWAMPIRASLAMVGMLFMWVGMFDSVAIYVGPDSYDHDLYETPAVIAKDSICLLTGLALLAGTKTYYNIACIPLLGADADDEVAVTPADPPSKKLRVVGRAVLAVLGQILVWMGIWNFLENYSPESWWREAIYVLQGWVVFTLTKTWSRSYIRVDGKELPSPEPLPQGVRLTVVSAVSLLSGFMYIVGCWTLTEDYIWPETSSTFRNMALFVIGSLGMICSGTFSAHACIALCADAPDADETTLLPEGASLSDSGAASTGFFGYLGVTGFAPVSTKAAVSLGDP
jgi:succinate dehydrogenase hydrophobic anchor subunit